MLFRVGIVHARKNEFISSLSSVQLHTQTKYIRILKTGNKIVGTSVSWQELKSFTFKL